MIQAKYAIDELWERDFTIFRMLYHNTRNIQHMEQEPCRICGKEPQRMFYIGGEFVYVLSGEKETKAGSALLEP